LLAVTAFMLPLLPAFFITSSFVGFQT